MSSYVLYLKGQVVGIVNENPFTGTPKMKEFPGITYDKAHNANGSDMRSFEEATSVADQLTALTGTTYLPFDDGECTSHRFGVIEAPKIGDDVSYGFNGDYYPCGKITRITPTLRVTATDERGNKVVFNRVKNSAGWRRVGGTWSMVAGIHDERNPHF